MGDGQYKGGDNLGYNVLLISPNKEMLERKRHPGEGRKTSSSGNRPRSTILWGKPRKNTKHLPRKGKVRSTSSNQHVALSFSLLNLLRNPPPAQTPEIVCVNKPLQRFPIWLRALSTQRKVSSAHANPLTYPIQDETQHCRGCADAITWRESVYLIPYIARHGVN